jgi:hypothetical protein
MLIQRLFTLWLLALGLAGAAAAHFVFITPDTDGKSARVFISENLTPDLDVKVIRGTTLHLMNRSGADMTLTMSQPEPAYFAATVPGSGTRVLFGKTDFGVIQRGSGKPHRLIYYPKALIGDAFAQETQLGSRSEIEIIPLGKPGAMQLQLVAFGKPVANGEIVVLLPDGTEERVKTKEDGVADATFTDLGRYGAWGRLWETANGTHQDKAYEEIRHYATLVVDAGSATPTAAESATLAPVTTFATMPEATSSFGAAVADGWLYVYGGHVARTHSYSKESVSGAFHRVSLSKPGDWESLPAGPGLQGMNLAAYNGKIYRVGGMAPQNEKGQPTDNRSTGDVARFDPATKRWEAMPALPEARSSHDVLMLGEKLYVVGGWILEGKTERWCDTMLVLDLSAKQPQWESLAQPFRRRALMAAARHGKIYVVGGITDKGAVVRNVSIYDPGKGEWTEGPQLPEGRYLGFSPAVGVHHGKLYAALGDGSLLWMDEGKQCWEKAAQVEARVAHRLVSGEGHLLVLGGAAKGKNFDIVERVAVAN